MRKWLQKIITSALAIGLLLSPMTVSAVNGTAKPIEQSSTSEISSLLGNWIAEMAKQPDFRSWKQAKFELMPLGPGTHNWLALIKGTNGKTAGYVVVQAVEKGGYTIGEYGLGQYLYNEQTLQQSLRQLSLIHPSANQQLYVHPLLAVWKTSDDKRIIYSDAMSGEGLPLDARKWETASTKEAQLAAALPAIDLTKKTVKLHAVVSNPSFDPYGKLPWLTDAAPLQASSKDVSKLLYAIKAKKQVQYIAERYGGDMLYAWSVTGYHDWNNGIVYAALETDELGESRRYIPAQLLAELGRFYR
ncbi:hypothetical protein [Paenibacillus radicis (ex Gao et al. 2016)]|uniref:Uncharacterized protein n=1 Tax=Paenibacillus radicis (ex Gao et al. 2016) TaxID=1737354 RepID=A0A917HNK9_9BACL|nr:hypothetical protein [Paenibacillus radicis (ex Gao et al. 2016)]GGG85743.1 hypothetical protein GCM10010918_49730 [Paenibacillus radicis (ex Gao et al. 2016)]